MMIKVELTGEDWEPDASMRYYAQLTDNGAFAFGATRAEAIRNLLIIVDLEEP